MIKLLNAGFTRLRKNKLFWLLTLFSIVLALFMIYFRYNDMKAYEDTVKVEQLMFNYSTIIGIVMSIFTSLFLGVEYSDGAIRNKISIGHKRVNIYLSNFIVTTITSLFSFILFIIVVAIVGIPLFGGITISFSQLLMILGCMFVTVIAYSSIFTFIAMMISNKTITAIVSIMFTFGLMMITLTCFNILNEQEYVDEYTMINGKMEVREVKNPKYPSEEKKKVCQTLVDINPVGQMIQLAEGTANIKVLSIYSLGIVVIFTGVGLVLFKKKELK